MSLRNLHVCCGCGAPIGVVKELHYLDHGCHRDVYRSIDQNLAHHTVDMMQNAARIVSPFAPGELRVFTPSDMWYIGNLLPLDSISQGSELPHRAWFLHRLCLA